MTSMDYDVDSIGGLMPQILALTAPPGNRDLTKQSSSSSSSSSKEGLAAHPYYRRPGRGHNHDSCDACGEGGDLICCDLCPASFHLTCHDPPLDESDIPTGQWACHQCRTSGPDDDRTSVSSGKSTKSTKGVKRKEKEEEKPVPNKIHDINEKRVCAGGREFEISDSPLSTLIKAAASVNPKQFTLPYEMTLPIVFPGEPKPASKTNGKKSNQKKKPYELDNGLVPLPAKLCFTCRKSCRTGPLIPCDFCPLFFHLDCLDPPLTSPPMNKWMCPNHPEHFLDHAILTSQSLTERVKLWDKSNGHIDQDAVKLSFLARCHRKNPPFRYKVKRVLRSRIRVPQAVKDQYIDRPELLPRYYPPSHLLPPPIYESTMTSCTTTTATTQLPNATQTVSPTNMQIKEEPLDDTQVTQETPDNREISEIDRRLQGEPKVDERKRATKEEIDQWLSGLLSLQASIVKHMACGSKSPDGREREINGPSPLDMSPPAEQQQQRPDCINGHLTHDSLGLKGTNRLQQTQALNSRFPPPPSYMPPKKGILKNQKTAKSERVGSSVKGSCARRGKQTASEMLSETLTSLASSLQSSITGKQDVSLSQLERSVVEVLAWQRLEELLCPPSPSPAVALTTPPLPARALLCPLVADDPMCLPGSRTDIKQPKNCNPVPMTYRILRIGKGSHNHVDLSTYGHCNYISQEHASIFYDENTGHYELINYSLHGTRVDSVMYKYDQSEKTVNSAPPPPLLQQVRAIIDSRRGIAPKSKDRAAMTDTPGQTLVRCDCKLRDDLNNSKSFSYEATGGWEGGAVLHHGSHLRFGCLQFVFSIVEDASKSSWVDATLTTYDKFFKQEEKEKEEEEEEDDDGDDEDEKDKEKEKESVKEKEKDKK
ncbi:unnamed protein product, partial [Meganyctiphanes norvegica]